MIKKYILNVLVAIDQLVNALIGGDPDETISSRASKNRHKWHWNILVIILDFFDEGHSDKTREDDEGGDAIFHEIQK